jgi:hypothetical protein
MRVSGKDGAMPDRERPLLPWMKFLLRFVAVFNIAAGAQMTLATKWTYWTIGMEEPKLDFPMKLVGILVAIFGYGYYLIARHPLENRNVLFLGMLSKGFGSVLGIYYILRGKLPFLPFFPVLFFADIIYLVPFWLILRRVDKLSSEHQS